MPVKLSTGISIDEEVFSALEYVSEIPEVGIEFLKDQAAPRPATTFRLFQALIRQAKTFYSAAKELHFRASALMYYYSFLNLAKAYIAIRNPSLVSGLVRHGLSSGEFARRSFDKQAVFVTRQRGVFHDFFDLELGQQPPSNFRLGATGLLGYCSDVKHEYERAQFGDHRLLPARVRLFANAPSKLSWLGLAVYKFDLIRSYRKSLAGFFDYFEEVSLDSQWAWGAYNIRAEAYDTYSYFQTKTVYPWRADGIVEVGKIRSETLLACGSLLESPIYPDGNDLKFVIPFRLNYQLPMNQPIAIYVMMFFIGSLVRYHPEYLEVLLNSKDAWIIERFVRGSSETFLRYMGNAILGTDYIYAHR